MSEKIKAVYLDSDGNQHETKATAKKANRLIAAADAVSDDIDTAYNGEQSLSAHARALAGDGRDDPEIDAKIIEFARAVVAIYGMRDKPEAK